MLQDFIENNLDMLDGIDTSEIEFGTEDFTSELEDLYIADNALYADIISSDIEGIEDDFHFNEDEIDSNTEEHHQHKEQKHDAISFKGHGSCKLCGCGRFAGHGNVCKNCGHFFSNHYSL